MRKRARDYFQKREIERSIKLSAHSSFPYMPEADEPHAWLTQKGPTGRTWPVELLPGCVRDDLQARPDYENARRA